jgi:hypothetical protein
LLLAVYDAAKWHLILRRQEGPNAVLAVDWQYQKTQGDSSEYKGKERENTSTHIKPLP